MQTLIQEKANVARLRDLYEKETDPLIKESISFRLAEARLWHDVAESGVLTSERIEPKSRHKIKCMFITITIAVIVMIAVCGCNVAREGLHLVGAAGQDIGWMANKVADNIDTEN